MGAIPHVGVWGQRPRGKGWVGTPAPSGRLGPGGRPTLQDVLPWSVPPQNNDFILHSVRADCFSSDLFQTCGFQSPFMAHFHTVVGTRLPGGFQEAGFHGLIRFAFAVGSYWPLHMQ